LCRILARTTRIRVVAWAAEGLPLLSNRLESPCEGRETGGHVLEDEPVAVHEQQPAGHLVVRRDAGVVERFLDKSHEGFMVVRVDRADEATEYRLTQLLYRSRIARKALPEVPDSPP
jgi:hypothetical protein